MHYVLETNLVKDNSASIVDIYLLKIIAVEEISMCLLHTPFLDTITAGEEVTTSSLATSG